MRRDLDQHWYSSRETVVHEPRAIRKESASHAPLPNPKAAAASTSQTPNAQEEIEKILDRDDEFKRINRVMILNCYGIKTGFKAISR